LLLAKRVKERGKSGPSRETLGVNKSEAKFREFLVRDTRTTPLPLFFVSVDCTGVRKRWLVSVDSKGGLSGFRMNRSEEFCKC